MHQVGTYYLSCHTFSTTSFPLKELLKVLEKEINLFKLKTQRSCIIIADWECLSVNRLVKPLKFLMSEPLRLIPQDKTMPHFLVW